MNFAHLHLLVNHVPVIIAITGIPVLALGLWLRNLTLTRTGLTLFVVAALAALAAYFTGEPAEEHLEGVAGLSETLIGRHEAAALAATIALGALGVLSLAALVFRRGRSRVAASVLLVLSLAPAALIGVAANRGGQIRHPEIRPGAVPVERARESARAGGTGPAAPAAARR